MPPPQLKPLSTLPRNDQAYRVDAIGNIQRNPNSPTNHLINVLVSPINKGWRYTRLFEASAVDPTLQKCYQISAGELFMFSPGCVIQNGKIVWTPGISTFNESLNIASNAVRFVVPGVENQNLIPSDVYHLGLASRSPFLAIERDGDPYSLLIPTMEILRFYYSGSSKLNQAIFSSKLTDLNDVLNLKECSFDEESGILDICLRQDYPDDDAAMIGHWYADEYAYKQVLNVWNSLVKFTQIRNFNYFPLEIGFPFVGETNIQGQGINLPTPNGFTRQRKLILTLLKCSHPRPFKKLIYRRDNQAGPGTNDTPGSEQRPTVGYRPRAVAPEAPDETDALDDGVNDPFANPSVDVQPVQIRVNDRRFPKIEIKKLEKKNSTHKGNQAPSPSDGSLRNQSTSEPAAGVTDAIRICIVPTEEAGETQNEDEPSDKVLLPASFETFIKVTEELKKCRAIKKIENVLSSQVKAKTGELMSRFPLEHVDKSDIKWSQVFEDGEVKARARRAMVVKIEARRGTHYLLEIERRQHKGPDGKIKDDQEFATYLFWNNHCEALNDGVITSLLRSLAESSFKGYKNTFKDANLNVFPKKHQGTAGERATLIMDSIIAQWKKQHPDYPDDQEAEESLIDASS